MIEKWRSFIVITPGQEIHARVRELVRELRPACDEAGHSVRWVHPSKVHLTMRFLGDVPVPLALALEDACRPLGAFERFNLGYMGLGAFPDASRPRVIWMGVSDPDGHVARLHAALTRILEEQGIASEKRSFSPHVTLGRVRKPGPGTIAPVFEALADEPLGEEVISKIIFYRSTLHSSGAVHEPKWVVDLGRERRPRET